MTSQKKRKLSTDSRAKESRASQPSPENQESADIFRKFFESRFQPLDGVVKDSAVIVAQQVSSGESDEDEDLDEDLDGFTDDDEGVPEVKVVDYTDVRKEDSSVLLDKQTRKALLSSKVSSFEASKTGSKRATKTKEESDEEPDDLKNDLALQRLLKESHLLDSASDLNPTGKNRHMAIDLRLQALGAKTSIYTQQKKMPKSQRIGIQAKAAKREDIRRRDARENGVILAKPTVSKPKGIVKKRDRGVGAPAVGKFSGGTLRLSNRDLTSIRGPSSKGLKGTKRGRR
ncbi:hypothetical protein BGW36DRAFT_356688 [Talaromyces proteolyticus]|uniref:Protein FAF1 n=1 Tax=Talaromyces proteolyticus TaxID=1131652 RepID=A0AAD4PZF9_9EURO|nr:uncharacterized protein BGW36DRAFT_356688 [Talaromyces proteolyticus]KAH8702575.1 hypothetical protein BGW36DRAFT_356688 [Talaromyces proteolyticus]